MSDFYDRAAAVLGEGECGIRWPYGLEPPPPSLRRADRAAYDAQAAKARDRQETMLAWAECYGLRLSPAGCCPLWLRRGASQRCRPSYRLGDPCTRYGTPHPDSGWMDHQTAWLKDSRPAAVTAAPYGIGEQDEQRLEYWEQLDERLRVARGTGWYGLGTEQILMWRRDRVAEMRPAGHQPGRLGPTRPEQLEVHQARRASPTPGP
ncbi:hypothetical protein [Streptomyces sp. NBC_00470]|uniref:hypothetical protein n=1 Tax=Streptomyces sp. NBC_00470 TaxID=2975753 RepID=UPI002F919648